ncbi:MAG: metallophosphoesterase [Flavobacteriales bacterium]|nr:metallophosphoesterase [Flavobacteriales bacterium]
MGVYAISDIHGEDFKFRKLLKLLRLKKTDILYLLGDYIDRGSQSKEVLDTIFLLLESGFDIRCIRGNHEQMLLDALSDSDVSSEVAWLKNGGDKTLSSFSTSEISRIPDQYVDFLKSLPYYLDYENYLLVHAGIDMTTIDPLSETQALLWLRDWSSVYDESWINGRTVIHGHTPMKASFLLSQENISNDVICIDNGSFMKGAKEMGGLCAFNLETKGIVIL